MAKRFKQEVLDEIRSSPDLFADVAKAMDVKPTSLPSILDRNGNSLNQYEVVVLVAQSLNKNPEEILEEENSEEVDKVNVNSEQN